MKNLVSPISIKIIDDMYFRTFLLILVEKTATSLHNQTVRDLKKFILSFSIQINYENHSTRFNLERHLKSSFFCYHNAIRIIFISETLDSPPLHAKFGLFCIFNSNSFNGRNTHQNPRDIGEFYTNNRIRIFFFGSLLKVSEQ